MSEQYPAKEAARIPLIDLRLAPPAKEAARIPLIDLRLAPPRGFREELAADPWAAFGTFIGLTWPIWLYIYIVASGGR